MSTPTILASDEGGCLPAVGDPAIKAEIESALRVRYEAGEIDTGLYDVGLSWVVMDNVDGEIQFQWFEEVFKIERVLGIS